jgi:microcystin-dependent protein
MSVPDPATTKWVPLWDTGASGGAAFGSIPGEIKMWSGSVLPNLSKYGKWVWADGSIYSAAIYPEAAASIDGAWKTAHGVADPGAGNFRAPDLRGVSPSGMDSMPGGSRVNRTTRAVAIVIAGRGGEEYHTITIGEVPAHAHGVTDPTHGHGITDPTHGHGISDPGHFHNIFSGNMANGTVYPNIAPQGGNFNNAPTDPKVTGVTVVAGATGVTVVGGATGVSIQNNGGGSAHENLPPTIFVPWIVRLDG